jgi:hypothetical protein
MAVATAVESFLVGAEVELLLSPKGNMLKMPVIPQTYGRAGYNCQ